MSSKRHWASGLINLIRKAFNIIRQILRILGEIIQETINTGVYLAAIAFKFIASPSMPCVMAIAVFVLVMIITAGQWARVGMWVASILGVTNLYGQTAIAGAGIFAGLCLNIFQMSSEMWRISRKFADYYAKQQVDVTLDEKDETVKQRLDKWLSFDHKNLKVQRKISYLIETGLVIMTSLFFNPSFFGFVLGAISLFAPEMSLKFVTSTISLLGGATNHQGSDDNPDQADYI
jgi:hypothetical protein